MDPDTEILIDYPLLFRIYKSIRVDCYMGTVIVPASVDPATRVTSKDVTIDAVTAISARLYLPKITTITPNHKKLAILVYYQGGSFYIYSAFAPLYHSYLNSLVSKSCTIAVLVDDRISPKNLLLAAYDDSWSALKWVLSLR